MLALTVPGLLSTDRWVVTLLHEQRTITSDLRALADSPQLRRQGDHVLHVPSRRAVPLLAAWSHRPLDRVSADEPARGTGSLVIRPATPAIGAMIYSSATPHWSPTPDPTVTWRERYRNRSWSLYETAPRG